MIIQKNSDFCLEAQLVLAHLVPGKKKKRKPILKFLSFVGSCYLENKQG